MSHRPGDRIRHSARRSPDLRRAAAEVLKARDIAVREMEIEDLPLVFALGERLFRAEESPILHRTWDEYEVIDYFSSDTEHCLVADDDGRIAGFVIGTIIEKRKSAWTYGYLVWLGVDPAFEGQGLAHRLVARITDLFVAGGARMMLVDTEADNQRAIDFFQREGFGQPVKHLYLSRNLRDHPAYRRHRKRDLRDLTKFP